MKDRIPINKSTLVMGFILSLLLVACTSGTAEVDPTNEQVVETVETPVTIAGVSERLPENKYDDLEIVTLLPRDAIPAIDDPQFLETDEADEFYDPDELVMGVEFNGDARAYSVPFLSGHEIVNDEVGGVKIAVTW